MRKNRQQEQGISLYREQAWEPFFQMLFEMEDVLDTQRQKDSPGSGERKTPDDRI